MPATDKSSQKPMSLVRGENTHTHTHDEDDTQFFIMILLLRNNMISYSKTCVFFNKTVLTEITNEILRFSCCWLDTGEHFAVICSEKNENEKNIP